ncbi:hypothetical protein P280DRAFT_360221, partial [Massarina eburnea CBS 473.64]
PTEPLKYTREAGKTTAYLIPFPKPRIRGFKTADIPDRFFIYTPPIPPLSKPAVGEKESHWHRTQRQWQEDVRKATLNKATPTRPKKPLQDLTLIYPPSLPLTPDQIRADFATTLLRTGNSSRKDAFVASALLPFAATIDAALILTLGGLTQISGAWAYTSTRGATALNFLTNRNKSTSSLSLSLPSPDPTPPISLHLHQSAHLETLRRYLDLSCLRREFSMFPSIEEVAGDVDEAAVLAAIGWRPVKRAGKDLEDERWQVKEAREDVRRVFWKGAGEWVGW